MLSRSQHVAHRRLTGAMLTLVLAASQIAGAAHLLLIEHGVCLEHGELVEGSATDVHAPRDGSRGGSASFEPILVHEAGDDHCAVIAGLSSTSTYLSAQSSVHSPACQAPTVVVAFQPPLPATTSEPRWLLAPKTSPPFAS